MSKIIESLKQQSKEAELLKARDVEKSFSESDSKKTRAMTQKQLAEIYFKSGSASGQNPELPAPTVIHVKEKRTFSVLPWLISILALALSVFTLLTTKKFEIDIRVVDTAAAVTAQTNDSDNAALPFDTEKDTAPNTVYNRQSVTNAAAGINPQQADLREVSLIQAEDISDIDLPEARDLRPLQFKFAGASVLNSTRDSKQITLSNSTLAGLAYAWTEFEPPLDATSSRIFFEIRGLAGSEKIELIFKDANGNSSLNWRSIRPFDEGVGTEWRPHVLQLESTPYFDGKRISQMRIEIGSQRTGNESNATVLIRNFQIWPNVGDGSVVQSSSIKSDQSGTNAETTLSGSGILEITT